MTEILTLRASATDGLLHTEAGVGKRNVVYVLAVLTDESGEVLTDQTGEVLIAFGQTAVTLLHAKYTDTLIHAEDL